MYIGAKAGISSSVLGSKNVNQHSVIGSKAGSQYNASRGVSTSVGPAIGDLGGGKSAPGNTRNAVGSGQRDAPDRPDGVRSMADPRSNKRRKTTESSKKKKAE